MNSNVKEFVRAATIRAIRTWAQSVLSLVTVGIGFFDVDWKTVVSVSITSMLISYLTSIATGLPETNETGKFIVDNSDPDKTKWTLQYNGDPDKLSAGDSVRFTVTEKMKGEGE